jgi:transposase
LRFLLSAGNQSDIEMAEPLVGTVGHAAHLIADKGYDSDAFRSFLRHQHLTPVIPPRVNRHYPAPTDWCLYAARHAIENLFGKLKHFRGLATRYDKTASAFCAMVTLACIVIWLRL